MSPKFDAFTPINISHGESFAASFSSCTHYALLGSHFSRLLSGTIDRCHSALDESLGCETPAMDQVWGPATLWKISEAS